MSNVSPKHTILSITRHALIVTLICYFPHFILAPWWLFILILIAVGYRLISDYFAYSLISKGLRLFLVVVCLILLRLEYGSIISNGFFIGFLLTFIGLKIIEIHQIRDIKILILCNFYLIFSALVVIQDLWIIAYLLIALIANLTLMLKLNAPEVSLGQISRKSIKNLLLAIPLSIILFYIFPRLAHPLWQVPSFGKSHVGFSEKLNPGAIAQLFNDDSIALRITFKDKPLLHAYWRGLVLSFYNGISWHPNGYMTNQFSLLPELNSDEGDYEILLEPHQKKWLFYVGHPVASSPNLLFSPDDGLINQNKKIIMQRFAYTLKIKPISYANLNPQQIALNTQLPKTINPRISAWAKEHFAQSSKDTNSFIHFLQGYIQQQPFWYTLSPPKLDTRNKMDSFWFDTQKGFCEHYASAVTVILRSVGIPSRVVVGYQGGIWNPLAQYLTIQQNDAHAWVEYWLENVGWQLFDPTLFIARERIEQAIRDQQSTELNQDDYNVNGKMSWLQHSQLFLESFRFLIERWFLFYNQDTQRDLLQKAGLGDWQMAELLQTTVLFLILFMVLMGIFYQWQQKKTLDPLLKQYYLLQKELKRFNISTHPSATLKQQCDALIRKKPDLSGTISAFLNQYEQLRLAHSSEENKKRTILLFKTLRKQLR